MSLAGTWYNELGSTMNLQVDNEGVITGTYISAVGQAKGPYPLYGAAASDPSSGGQAVAFVVAWVNPYLSSNAVTAWSGQWQMIGDTETITSFWLLTSETDPDSDWASTQVGQDTFTRTQPTQEQIEERSRRAAWSHPKYVAAK